VYLFRALCTHADLYESAPSSAWYGVLHDKQNTDPRNRRGAARVPPPGRQICSGDTSLTATSVPAYAKGSGGGGGNNGLGNGDQTAPGGSLPHNGAENNTGGNTTGNPPGSGNFPVVPN
jgi:hypothetical protein